MRKVVHIIPYDGIGGVERAAATAEGARRGDLVLERMFVFEDVVDRSGRGATFDPRTFWMATGRLIRTQPDLVILSLWRAVIVGGLARLRGCRAPMVLFLHNARDAHVLDKFVTRLALRWVNAVWADSSITLSERLPNPPLMPKRVISYLLDRHEPVRNAQPDPKPDMIFWGRLTSQKDPLRMLALFALLHALRPEATLTVIGPDGGLEASLRAEIVRRGLKQAVTLTGPLPPKEIVPLAARASFYLQTSRYEGMALSVMEAMQAGLVPVVVPVGEISRYTADGRNAIWIGGTPSVDDHLAVMRIQEALDQPAIWRELRAEAIGSSAHQPLYSDDLIDACAELLRQQSIADHNDCQ